MNIKIIGSGCKKCENLSDSVKKVASENNIDCTIEKITDIEKIIEMGIVTTPVLMIDGESVAVGKVPSEGEILGYLKKDATACSCKKEAKENSCGCACSCGKNKGSSAKKLLSLLLLAFVIISLGYVVYRESSSPTPSQCCTNENVSSDTLVVYYFHGNKRCFSCNNIESFTKKTLEEKFKAKLEDSSIIFKSINIEEPQNEHFIKDFALPSRCVVLQKGDKFERLEKVWEYAKNEEAMLPYIENSINNFLK
ncbi:MAG: nitrophenyl compound nitroreductase subunit ArsF family protein [Opitutales bacterium]